MLTETLSPVQAVAAVFCIYFSSWIIYCRYFHPLHAVPGPFLASISRSWIVWKTMSGDMEHTQRALHKKHGYLVRIAPNEVSCSDPDAIKIIYGTRSTFTKTDYYTAWTPPNRTYPGHFSVRDEKQHSERRRIVQNAYSMSSVLENEHAIDNCTQIFCENMREFAVQKQVVDLGLWTNLYAFDVLGELFFGQMFGFMKERKDIGGYMKAIDSLLPAFTIGGTVPSYLTKIYLLSTTIFSPSVRGALGAIKQIEAASKAAVKRRKQEMVENINDKRDIVRKLLEIEADRGAELDFTFEHIQVESYSSLFAGADTTAVALNSILYHLMLNSDAYSKLKTEVDSAISDGTLSMPVLYAQAIKLPYLKACVNEGMRLHPSVALTLPRHVPNSGATISGFYFPAGYRVGINGAVVQYDKDVFGQDADVFNPSRWIDGDSQQHSRMEKTMVQFGAGSRTCIGKNISLSEIYKLVPQILRDFEFRLVDPKRSWKTHNYWFNKQTGIEVHVETRKHNY